MPISIILRNVGVRPEAIWRALEQQKAFKIITVKQKNLLSAIQAPSTFWLLPLPVVMQKPVMRTLVIQTLPVGITGYRSPVGTSWEQCFYPIKVELDAKNTPRAPLFSSINRRQ
ncbi:MAG: hypothetical protein ACI8Z1_001408 [Candidatus Azotimanducaceae bacterium]|jgi:hypothetical protein